MTAVDDVVTATSGTQTEPDLSWWTERPVWVRGSLRTAQSAPETGWVRVDGALMPTAEVIPLPKVGERMPKALQQPGSWVLGLTVLAAEPQVVLSLTYITLGGHVGSRRLTDAEVVQARVTGPAEPDATRQLAQAVHSMHTAFEAWRSRATEIAHDYANENDLCERFDQAMREIGLPVRTDEVSIELCIEASPHTICVDLERDDDVHEWFGSLTHDEVRARVLESVGVDPEDDDARRLYDALVDDVSMSDYCRG